MEWLEVLERVAAGEGRKTEFKRLFEKNAVGKAICAMIFEFLEDSDYKDRHVRPAAGASKARVGKRLGTGKDHHLPAPRVPALSHHRAHSSPQSFGDLHFVAGRSDRGGGQPSGMDRPQDRDSEVRFKIDARAAGVRFEIGIHFAQVPPLGKLLASKAVASSRPSTPIQC